jgi:aryl-alcohol dehydrogenase-like predicted oxidoreductase
MWDGADGEGLSRSHVERAVEDSLRRLQIETIDLYQTHWPDESTPIEETLTVFGELVNSGKVRYIGLSNYPTGMMREALSVAGKKDLPRFVSLQPHYNLVWREEYERSKASFCEENNIAVIPYSPLEGGFLTGKYRRGQEPPKSARAGGVKRFLTDDGFAVVEALDEVASARKTTLAAVALAWLLTKPAVVAPIIGANSPAQLADLLPASELTLSRGEIMALDEVSEPFTAPMNR